MNALADQLTTLQTSAPAWWPALVALPGAGAVAAVARPKVRAARAAREPRGSAFDRAVFPVAVVAVAILGVGALWSSVWHVTAMAAARGIDPAWLPAAVIDGAIAIFTGLDLVLAHKEKRVAWLGRMQTALVGTTVLLNVWGQPDLFGVVFFGAQPAVWKACVAALKATKAAQHSAPVDRIPVARWALAPITTFRLWRWMVLGHLASYETAVELDGRRLQDRISADPGGASPMARQIYEHLAGEPLPEIDVEPDLELPAAEPEPSPTPAPTKSATRRRPTAKKPAGRRTLTDDQLADVAVALDAKNPEAGVLNHWKAMVDALREAKHPIGSQRGPAVLDLARARKENPDA